MPDDEAPPTEEPTAQERARRRDRPLVQRAIVSDALMDPEERARMGFDPSPAAPIPVVIELNLRHRDGLEGAAEQFLAHFRSALPDAPDAGAGGRHLLPVRAHRGRHPAPGRGRPAPGGRRPAGHLPGLARLPGPPADRHLLRHRQGRRGQALLRRHRPRHHLGGAGLRHRRRAPPLPPLRHPQGRRGQPAPRLHQAGRADPRRRPGRPVRPRHPRGRDHRRRPARPDAAGQQPAGGRAGLRPGPSRDPEGPGPPGQPARGAGRDRPGDQAGQPQGAQRVGQRPVHERAPGARVRPQGHQRLRQAAAGPRGQPQPRLRVRPQVVRLRPEPHLRRGRPPGPVGGGGGRGRRQHRLRQPHLPGPPDQRRADHDHQRPRQRRPGHHRRRHPPRHAPHLRGVVLLLQGPHRRRPAQAGPGRPRRAHHLVRRRQGADQRLPRRAGPGARPHGRVRGGLRHQHGRPPRLGGGGQLPVHPPRVHRPPRRRQAGSSRSRPPPWAASATSRATAWST